MGLDSMNDFFETPEHWSKFCELMTAGKIMWEMRQEFQKEDFLATESQDTLEITQNEVKQ